MFKDNFDNKINKNKDWQELYTWKEEQEKIKIEKQKNTPPKLRGLEKLEKFLDRFQTTVTIFLLITFFVVIISIIFYYNSLDV